jgi:ABC-type transport system involved in multi-copper enzyme maturation permease subunit
MGSPPQVGWLGRTFGIRPTLGTWGYLAGLAGWLAVWGWLLYRVYTWSVADVLLANVVWVGGFLLVHHRAVREMFGPVFFYEVVRLGRRPMTFTVRFLFGLGVSLVLALMFAVWLEEIGYYSPGSSNLLSTQKLSEFATYYFHVYAIVSYSAVVVLTPVYVAGAIAVEKERKTLEFLLATDLRNREIVFGKVAARVLTLLGFSLVGMPILAILQLFGGIDAELLFGLFFVTVLTVVGLAAVSIWMSALLRRARDAILLTYLMLLIYIVFTFVLAMLSMIPQPWVIRSEYFDYEFTLPAWVSKVMFTSGAGNPLVALLGTLGPPAIRGPVTGVLADFTIFWLLVTVVCLTWAVVRVRTVALQQSYGTIGRPRKKQKQPIPQPAADGSTRPPEPAPSRPRPSRRYPEVGDNPVLWKEVFVDSGFMGGAVWRVLSVLGAMLVVGPFLAILYFHVVEPNASASATQLWYTFTEAVNVWARIVTGFVVTLMFFAVAIRGAGAVSGEKDRDTWVSLVGTPLTAEQMLWGKWWGCVLGMRKPLALLVSVWAIALACGAFHPITILPTVYAVALFLGLFAWVGLYCSMRAKNSLTASIQAFFVTALFAGGFWVFILLCCFLPLGIAGVRGQTIDHLAQVGVGFTPPLICAFLPFRTFEKYDLGPFDPEYGLGIGSLALGLVFWTVLTALLGVACQYKFRGLTNRAPVYLPGERAAREAAARRAARGAE